MVAEREIITREQERKIDRLILGLWDVPETSVKHAAIKAYICGKLMSRQLYRRKPLGEIIIDDIPVNIRELVAQYGLTAEEVRVIGWLEEYVLDHLTWVQAKYANSIRTIIREAKFNRLSAKSIAARLFDEIGVKQVLNADFRRFAITIANEGARAGYVMEELHRAEKNEEVFIEGVSKPDACAWCKRNINGKILKVLREPPADYSQLGPGTDEYNRIAHIWDTCWWVGKGQYGRSRHRYKRAGEGELIQREHHEIWTPGVDHPSGRCTFVRRYSDEVEKDYNGNYLKTKEV